jgi:acetyl-CoA synthetase
MEGPVAKWFLGGRLNLAVSASIAGDTPSPTRPPSSGKANPPPTADPARTHPHLQATPSEVCRFANVLKRHGVGTGDRVLIYLPLVPEAAIAMPLCRIGAVPRWCLAGSAPIPSPTASMTAAPSSS